MNNSRHSAIFSIPPNEQVTIIGAGGLGATTALTLAKMGYRYMTIYDGDVVSEENTGTQLHKPADIGMSKVTALMETIEEFSDDIFINAIRKRVGANEDLSGRIIISAVDSINARKDIWNAVMQSGADWYIEMRMGAELCQIHTVNLNGDWEWYDDYITGQTEEGVPDAPCSMKSTFFCGMFSAGLVGSIVRKLHTNIPVCHKLVFDLVSNTILEI